MRIKKIRKKRKEKFEKKNDDLNLLLDEVRPLFEERFKYFTKHTTLNSQRLLTNDLDLKKDLARQISAVLDKTVELNRQIYLKLRGNDSEHEAHNVQ